MSGYEDEVWEGHTKSRLQLPTYSAEPGFVNTTFSCVKAAQGARRPWEADSVKHHYITSFNNKLQTVTDNYGEASRESTC